MYSCVEEISIIKGDTDRKRMRRVLPVLTPPFKKTHTHTHTHTYEPTDGDGAQWDMHAPFLFRQIVPSLLISSLLVVGFFVGLPRKAGAPPGHCQSPSFVLAVPPCPPPWEMPEKGRKEAKPISKKDLNISADNSKLHSPCRTSALGAFSLWWARLRSLTSENNQSSLDVSRM